MPDYTALQRAYAYHRADAHLLLEDALQAAAGHCTNDRELGRIARHLAAAVEAGKAQCAAEIDKEGNA